MCQVRKVNPALEQIPFFFDYFFLAVTKRSEQDFEKHITEQWKKENLFFPRGKKFKFYGDFDWSGGGGIRKK